MIKICFTSVVGMENFLDATDSSLTPPLSIRWNYDVVEWSEGRKVYANKFISNAERSYVDADDDDEEESLDSLRNEAFKCASISGSF